MKDRILELIQILNQAAMVYYQGKDEIMSNYEYDQLYAELEHLEKESGILFSNSPTQRVGYEVLSELPKEQHDTSMLSLDKTKDANALADWLGDQTGMLSWKMDGLTVVLHYMDGKLTKAVTRGNGQVGEVITNNAKVFKNIPLTIAYSGKLVLRGEAIISYSEFEKINQELPLEEQYKNPRNLCSGTVRQLNNEITAKRNVQFYAFSLVEAAGVDFQNSQEQKMLFLKNQGFDIVEYEMVTADTVSDAILGFEQRIKENDFPSDGLVLLMDDIAYGEQLGNTAKFPRNAMAFKWKDETALTKLIDLEWSASRTGQINPVAVFEPVELEGTSVSRASVHNVSIVKQLELGIGDEIQVYKANMIIPQIAENLTRSYTVQIPTKCPVCKEPTSIHEDNQVQVLFCDNPACLAKKLKSFSHFVSRDALNIEGMSEATIERFINEGILHELADIFKLSQKEEQITQLDGFGKKSYQKLIEATQKASTTTLTRFLYGLGILNIGVSNARVITKAFGEDLDRILHATEEELTMIEGVGPVLAHSFVKFFAQETNQKTVENLLEVVTIQAPQQNTKEQTMEGLTFVITGSVQHFSNRNEVKNLILERGGKVAGSVSAKTDYLINNDAASNSSKNKKAKELGIPIITEEQWMKQFQIEPIL